MFFGQKGYIMCYRQLAPREKYHIEFNFGKMSLRQIAIELNRAVSTISREVKRCLSFGFTTYVADYKEIINSVRERACYKLKGKLLRMVKYLLKKKFSPEQISHYLWLKKGIKISHQAIYNWIYNKAENKAEYIKPLRIKSKHKQRNKSGKVHIPNLKTIDEREDKSVLIQQVGNFELDTMLGKCNKSAILTMVDMLSKYVFIVKIDGTKAKSTEEAVIGTLKHMKNHIDTLTMDNGREFCNHTIFGNALGAKTYFTHPHSPWEKGLIENTNGLIRQYFPKGTDFNLISEEELKFVQNELNNRPRKTLGWRTPKEVFTQHLKCCT